MTGNGQRQSDGIANLSRLGDALQNWALFERRRQETHAIADVSRYCGIGWAAARRIVRTEGTNLVGDLAGSEGSARQVLMRPVS